LQYTVYDTAFIHRLLYTYCTQTSLYCYEYKYEYEYTILTEHRSIRRRGTTVRWIRLPTVRRPLRVLLRRRWPTGTSTSTNTPNEQNIDPHEDEYSYSYCTKNNAVHTNKVDLKSYLNIRTKSKWLPTNLNGIKINLVDTKPLIFDDPSRIVATRYHHRRDHPYQEDTVSTKRTSIRY